MSVKALQEYTRVSKYARYNKEKGRRETWDEQVNRVFDMHEKHLGQERIDAIKEEFYFAKSMMQKKKILGSQRALQFGGEPILQKNAKLFNCSAEYIDRVRAFQEFLYLLLCGVGVGASVQKHHIAKLPDITKPTKGEKVYTIPDSIEGWADAMGVLASSYFTEDQTFPEYFGYTVKLDYSLIRPEGSPIKWGGKAPGPKGLENSMKEVVKIFDSCLSDGRNRLKPIEVYDILMHQSDACLSGGIRRSACLVLFTPDDEEMTMAKTGDWFIKNPQRGRSNNSALILRNETSREDFAKLMKSVKEYGEPGFIWADNKELLFNPCLTTDVWITTSKGPKQIQDLVGHPFVAIVNGKEFESTSNGFVKTGNREVFSIRTNEGFNIKSTDNHMFLVDIGGSLEWVEVKNIRVGDKIVINNHENNIWPGDGTFQEGWLLGNLKGDGNIVDKRKTANLEYWGENANYMIDYAISLIDESNIIHRSDMVGGNQSPSINGVEKMRVGCSGLYKLSQEYGFGPKKRINNKIENTSSDFHVGFIRGWFDADGSVQGNRQKGVSVRLSSVDIDGLHTCQRMLCRLGVMSRIHNRQKAEYRSLPDGNGGYSDYFCQATYELIISRDSITKFKNIVGFSDNIKTAKLNDITESYIRMPYSDKFVATVNSIIGCGVEDVYDCTINKAHCFDANGFVSHNCGEIGLYAYDEDGNSGVEFCNLTTINVKKCKTPDDFYNACRASAILGTIQASYTDFPYLGEVSERIAKRESLIGCSMTGIMDNVEIALNPEIQRHGAEIIKEVNKEIAELIGINQAARCTTVKPEGSASCLVGSSSGIHPNHSKRYIRRVQANKNEVTAQFFRSMNPNAVEDSVWSNSNTDWVISFLCEVPNGARIKDNVTAIDLLGSVKLTQQNWVSYGKNESLCAKPWLSHNVSNTITVKPDEWDEVEEYIYNNRQWFAGISLLPSSGDLDYPQAPFMTVLTHKEIVDKFGEGALFASGLIVDALKAFNNNLWAACDCALGIGEQLDVLVDPEEPQMPEKNGYTAKKWSDKLLKYAQDLHKYQEEKDIYDIWELKSDWVRRFKQFAVRYSEGNYKACAHMLKHVHNWKLWLDLKRNYVDVDWTLCQETEEGNLDTGAGGACAGGSCEIGELGLAIQAANRKA